MNKNLRKRNKLSKRLDLLVHQIKVVQKRNRYLKDHLMYKSEVKQIIRKDNKNSEQNMEATRINKITTVANQVCNRINQVSITLDLQNLVLIKLVVGLLLKVTHNKVRHKQPDKKAQLVSILLHQEIEEVAVFQQD